jgi:hypothetical protein
MWALVLKSILGFLGGPGLESLVEGYKAKLAAGNTAEKIAADLAAKELDLEQRERELAQQQIIAEEGRWWTAAPRAVVCWSFAIYVAKCVVWDNVLHLGVTYALKGDLATWGGWLMALWFGGRSAEKIARILKP